MVPHKCFIRKLVTLSWTRDWGDTLEIKHWCVVCDTCMSGRGVTSWREAVRVALMHFKCRSNGAKHTL